MRTFSAIFLLFCLIAPIGGTYVWLKMEKSKVKKEFKWRMIHGMDKSELALFKLTKKESEVKLRWEHSQEFEYSGQMYDVVEVKEVDDTIWYWCWWDHEETKLNRQLNELVANAVEQNPSNKEKQECLNNFLKNLYCSVKSDKSSLVQTAGKIFPSAMHSDYSFIYYAPPAPPPEIV